MGDEFRWGRFSTVLLDFDGICVDSVTVHALSWQRAFTELGASFSWQDWARLWDDNCRVPVPYRSVFELLADQGMDLEVEEQRRIWERRRALLADEGADAELMDAGAAVFELAARHGQEVVVVTNSDHDQVERALAQIGVSSRVRAVVSAATLGVAGKPAPDCYESALALVGVPRSQVCVVEDSPVGAEAGLKAGLEVVYIENTVTHHLRPPDGVSRVVPLDRCGSRQDIIDVLLGE